MSRDQSAARRGDRPWRARQRQARPQRRAQGRAWGSTRALAFPALLCALVAIGFALPSNATAQTLKDLLDKRREQRSDAPQIAPAPDGRDEGREAEKPAESRLSPEEALELAYANLLSDEEPVWRAAEQKIMKSWARSGSDSMDLLLMRGRTAIEKEDWDAALEHLTNLVNLAPDFAEGWSARASVYFRKSEFGLALADLGEAIVHDPRHFGAYAGIGVIFEQLDDAPNAIAAYRRSLEIHPNLAASKEAVDRLAGEAEGRPI